jgi:hypothetical protein
MLTKIHINDGNRLVPSKYIGTLLENEFLSLNSKALVCENGQSYDVDSISKMLRCEIVLTISCFTQRRYFVTT